MKAQKGTQSGMQKRAKYRKEKGTLEGIQNSIGICKIEYKKELKRKRWFNTDQNKF